jgi:hypothetical protein
MTRAIALLLSVLAASAFGQTQISTLCGVVQAPVSSGMVDLRLVGCGDGFTGTSTAAMHSTVRWTESRFGREPATVPWSTCATRE